MDEFEKWFYDNLNFCVNSATPKLDGIIKEYFKKCWNHQQSKLDEKDKELEALRGFAISVYKEKEDNFKRGVDWDIAKHFIAEFLIDESGNPTPLLTGVKPETREE